ncbi:MAG: hypothetical protein H6679_01690 [Epsilonproteobacteria bacterium]|nr:hypothetical protein [Campylobacterota bacterium]
MVRKIIRVNLLCFTLFSPVFSFYMDNINDAQGRKKEIQLEVLNFFQPTKPRLQVQVVTDPYRLKLAAQDALRFLQANRNTNQECVHPHSMEHIISEENVEQTLQFVIDTVEKDMQTQNFRILDPEFLKENFSYFKWQADHQSATQRKVKCGPDGKIRLTNYAIFTFDGSPKKTEEFSCALYALRDESIQNKYTKHEVLNGALEERENKGKAKPLVWLSRKGLEDALMQGTVLVTMPNGSQRVFNVDRNNGIPYDQTLKDMYDQKRYWYFREIPLPKNSDASSGKYHNRNEVVFAGDIDHIGIGKLIAVKGKNPVTGQEEMRLGILADTGGAFENNLYQLDLYVGVFKDRPALKSYIKQIPEAVDAYLLYRSS